MTRAALMPVALAISGVAIAFATSLGITGALADKRSAAAMEPADAFPFERTAQDLRPTRRRVTVDGLGTAAPLPSMRRAARPRPVAAGKSLRTSRFTSTTPASTTAPATLPPSGVSAPAREVSAPRPVTDTPSPAPARSRPAPARPAPARPAPARPAPDDFDSGESFDSTG